MVDYLDTARKLRAKAADKAVPEAEKLALIERAKHLEDKYGKRSSPSTNDTTVTGRDGFWYEPGNPKYEAWVDSMRAYRQDQASKIAEDLLKNQWRWNREYYDEFGNPWTVWPEPDPADLIADEYKTDPPEDEDYGYDYYESEDYDQKVSDHDAE